MGDGILKFVIGHLSLALATGDQLPFDTVTAFLHLSFKTLYLYCSELHNEKLL